MRGQYGIKSFGIATYIIYHVCEIVVLRQNSPLVFMLLTLHGRYAHVHLQHFFLIVLLLHRPYS